MTTYGKEGQLADSLRLVVLQEGNDGSESAATNTKNETTSSQTSQEDATASETTSCNSELTSNSSSHRRQARLDRRKHRIRALQQGRNNRLAAAKCDAASSHYSIEDHPLYNSRRQERINAIKRQSDCSDKENTSSQKVEGLDPSPHPEPNVGKAVREELVAAYQLIHRQRVRIQQLEKLHDPNFFDPTVPKRTSREQIPELQAQIINLQHERAQAEFDLRARITDDALGYAESVTHYHKQAKRWKERFDMTWDAMEDQSRQAQSQIVDLELALVAEKRRRERERSKHYSSSNILPQRMVSRTSSLGSTASLEFHTKEQFLQETMNRTDSPKRRVSWSRGTIFNEVDKDDDGSSTYSSSTDEEYDDGWIEEDDEEYDDHPTMMEVGGSSQRPTGKGVASIFRKR